MAALVADVQRTRAAAVSREVADALTAAEWRVADCQGGLRDLQQAREREARLRTVQEMFERATAPLEVPAEPAPLRRRKGGHRRDPAGRARVWAVKGFAPAGAAAWAAQHAAGLSAASAGTAATIALGTALAVTSPAAHSARHDPLAGQAPAVSGPEWTAVPVSPSAPARPDAAKASTVPSPAATPSPVPSSLAPPPPQRPGTLVADSTVLRLGALGAATVTLTAQGGAGVVAGPSGSRAGHLALVGDAGSRGVGDGHGPGCRPVPFRVRDP